MHGKNGMVNGKRDLEQKKKKTGDNGEPWSCMSWQDIVYKTTNV